MIPQAAETFFHLPNELIAKKKFIGKSDHRDVYSVSVDFDDEPHFILFNEDSQGVSSYLIVREDVIIGRDSAVIVRSWTRPDIRNKGYLSTLVKFIKDFLKMQVVSDNLHTPSSREFWDRLRKKFEIKTLDTNNSAIIDTDVYSLPSYRLIIESRSPIMRKGLKHNIKKNINEWVDPILIPLICFAEGDV